MNIKSFIVGPVQTNCYVIWKEGEKEALVFDPGASGKQLFEEIEKMGLAVGGIFITHGHFDHICGVKELKELSGCKVYGPESEKRFFSDVHYNHSALYGLDCTIDPDVYLQDLETVKTAGFTLQVIYTPGHTEGGCCYYLPEEETLFSGDTLFRQSVGRTDMETGNMDVLEASIRERLYVLPEETKVYPGHMDPTTIGYEKSHNFFVRA